MGPSSSEYYVQTTITNTEEYPAQLTSCHSHGDETYVYTARIDVFAANSLDTACPTMAKRPSWPLRTSNLVKQTPTRNTAISTLV